MLFTAPMVRALLAGTKTQTRRAVKPQPAGEWAAPGRSASPYGQPGDRLWVRETFFAFGRWETRYSEKKGRDEWHFIDMTLQVGHAYTYAADDENGLYAAPRSRDSVTPGWWKRPAIFMPRAASRIQLEITNARVERLQSISEADAQAEGCDLPASDQDWAQARGWYRELWEALNGAGSWDANPWVWAIDFRRIAEAP